MEDIMSDVTREEFEKLKRTVSALMGEAPPEMWPEVTLFAMGMKNMLDKHKAKGKSWKGHSLRSLTRRVVEEAVELLREVEEFDDMEGSVSCPSPGELQRKIDKVMGEAFDVGNMAMMVFDRARNHL